MWELIAQTVDTGVDLGPAIQSLGIGSLIAVPAWVICWQLWKRLGEEQQRNRELSDRLGPLLAQSVEILSKAPQEFDRALTQATTSTRSSEVDAFMRKLEATIEQLKDR